ncbi:MAG: DsrE family protein [Gammaproteobacteria bacterium]|nr:DsrE family protein [Gammaproteobacteria bacterium]MCK5091556.1 DsrE family protein [Gammaproteobacteria bacterium]
MKLAIIIYSNDAETVWNAFRLGNTALDKDDEVTIFLLGEGVECVTINSIKFNIKVQMELFSEYKGNLIGCGVCCDLREDKMPSLREDLHCKMGSMQTLYKIIRDHDKVLTF